MNNTADAIARPLVVCLDDDARALFETQMLPAVRRQARADLVLAVMITLMMAGPFILVMVLERAIVWGLVAFGCLWMTIPTLLVVSGVRLLRSPPRFPRHAFTVTDSEVVFAARDRMGNIDRARPEIRWPRDEVTVTSIPGRGLGQPRLRFSRAGRHLARYYDARYLDVPVNDILAAVNAADPM